MLAASLDRGIQPVATLGAIVEETLAQFAENVMDVLPAILTGLVFLAVSYVAIKVIMFVVNRVLRRTFRNEPVYVQLTSTIVAVFLWFGVLLSVLTAVGLGAIAASLGTASGFLALGVSYALSDMIKDAVAGVYLLRDPDFEVGDRVVAADTDGVVEAIELRKTRFAVEGDTVVRGNAEIEKRWTKRGSPAD